jgi:hypothetical protein
MSPQTEPTLRIVLIDDDQQHLKFVANVLLQDSRQSQARSSADFFGGEEGLVAL